VSPFRIHPKSMRRYAASAARVSTASSLKHWRAVRTPAISSAVSIDENSLLHTRAPVFALTKCGKPAALVRQCAVEKQDRHAGAAGRRPPRQPAAFGGDARLARPKPVAAMLATSRWFSSCGAPSVRARSRTWPLAGIRLLVEVAERAALQVFEERLVLFGQGIDTAVDRRGCERPPARRDHNQRSDR
jgi:hypothetical protein